jgi:transketolase
MRNTFANELLNKAQNDPSVVLLTGDLGFGVLDKFQENLPNQFFNCGVALYTVLGIFRRSGVSNKFEMMFVTCRIR